MPRTVLGLLGWCSTYVASIFDYIYTLWIDSHLRIIRNPVFFFSLHYLPAEPWYLWMKVQGQFICVSNIPALQFNFYANCSFQWSYRMYCICQHVHYFHCSYHTVCMAKIAINTAHETIHVMNHLCPFRNTSILVNNYIPMFRRYFEK